MKISIILATTAAAILTGAAAVALNAFQPMTDNDPTGASAHALSSLWEEFSKEQKADKPKSAAEVLKKIKEEASAKRLHSDFYDASVKYAEVLASVNWKERDALNEGARKEILAYDEPIVTFTWKVDRSYSSSTEVFRYVENEKGRLSASRTPYFHEGIGSVMGGEMRSFVENDYEYALWRLVITRNLNYDNPSQDEIYSTLSEYLGDRYPGKAYLEFYAAEKRPDYIAKGLMEKLVEKYSGKAVSFWPRQELLLMRKRDLDKNSGTSAQYKALYDDCMAFEKEREALKGDERKIASGCIAVSNLIETLTAKSVSAEVVAGKIVVTFMNVDKADVNLFSIDPEGKKIADIAKWKVENKTKSFYLNDTEKVDLPRVDDGRYRLDTESGSLSDMRFYRQFSLSFAESRDDGCPVFYVADAKSGKPCGKVDLTLFNGTKVIATANLGVDANHSCSRG